MDVILPLFARSTGIIITPRTMAFRGTAEEMEKFQLSDEDTEDLWDSPSKRKTKNAKPKIPSGDGTTTPEPKPSHEGVETLFDRQESREAALRNELQSVRNINEVIEGLLGSLDRAKGNMNVCCVCWHVL